MVSDLWYSFGFESQGSHKEVVPEYIKGLYLRTLQTNKTINHNDNRSKTHG